MYKEEDFKHLRFNPLVKKNMVETYPVLNDLLCDVDEDFDGHADTLLRFIILCYDTDSPLVRKETNYKRRKDIAADLLKINKDFDFREEYFAFKDKNNLSILINYLKQIIRNETYAVLVALEFKFWESIAKISAPIADNSNTKAELEAVQKKSVLADELDKDISRISKYRKDFFGNDESLFETEHIKKWTPEQIGKKP